MTSFEAVVLGIVQGLTEFLPISSTAHLRIVPAFVGWDDPGAAFTAVIQLGTMAAVLLYFRADMLRICLAWLRGLRDPEARGDARLADGLVHHPGHDPDRRSSASMFNNQIETGARNLELIGSTLIAFGSSWSWPTGRAVSSARDRDRSIARRHRRSASRRRWRSCRACRDRARRSRAGLFRGPRPAAAAARYSFLLSIPAVVLSGLFELRKIGEPGGAAAAPTAIATVLAFVVGYASIAFLLRYLTRHGLGSSSPIGSCSGSSCSRWPSPASSPRSGGVGCPA